MTGSAPVRPRLRSRLPGLGPPHIGTMSTYGKDRSGTKTYRFNTLGYRGEEESASAQRRIYAGGCSITFGEGLNLEETWPQQFKQRYAAVSGIAAEAVNVLNFAESGAGNDRIVRTMLEQCRAAKPDLVLAQFTYPNRTEYLMGQHSINLGQWFLPQDLSEQPQDMSEQPPEWLRVLQQIADHYYQFYTDEWGVAASMREMLLLQSFCKAENIPCLILWVVDHDREFAGELSDVSSSPVCASLEAMLDRDRFVPLLDIFTMDKAADGRHPGPEAHKLMAEGFFALYQNLVAPHAGKEATMRELPPSRGRPDTLSPGADVATGIKKWLRLGRRKQATDPNIYPLW